MAATTAILLLDATLPLLLVLILAAAVVILALLKKGDVKTEFKLPGVAFALEAKDRRAASKPSKKQATKKLIE